MFDKVVKLTVHQRVQGTSPEQIQFRDLEPLYHAKPSNDIGEGGYLAYKMFDKVVKLTVHQRVQGTSPEQIQFRDLLLRLRLGETTAKDWQLLYFDSSTVECFKFD